MNTKELVAQIHNEFRTATVDSDTKPYRLVKLGFTKAKNTEGIDAKILELEAKYRMKYPLHKFIANEAIERLCKKYHLVYAPIDRYKGDVPEKNITEIELFLNRHGRDIVAIGSPYYEFKLNGVDYTTNKFRKWAHKQPDSLSIEECIDKLVSFGVERNFAKNHFKFTEPFDVLAKDNLYICAPKKDIDMGGLVFSGLSYNVPDPVVICKVPYGGIIISAWGDEASDEEVLNSLHN